jgi:hypothetical protein
MVTPPDRPTLDLMSETRAEQSEIAALGELVELG